MPDVRGDDAAPRDDRQVLTLFVSDALQLRLDSYRTARSGRSNTSIAFEAIRCLADTLSAVVASAHVPLIARPEQTHRLGSGPVQVQLRLTRDQAATLEVSTHQLHAASSADWLPPVLNAYLPGRKEPTNMPWLVPAFRSCEAILDTR